MSKKIQLSIAEPCHENWDNMSPVDKGKFCGSCQKQVVDFSTMSDRQVGEFFKKPSTGSVCGRFMTEQLEREIEIPKKRIPWVKYFFQIALPAFFISKASAQNIKMGKMIAKPVTKDTTRSPVANNLLMTGMVATNICIKPIMRDTVVESIKGEIAIKTIIKGKVINENGEPVAFASIETGKTGTGIMADSNGVFELDKNLLANDRKLFISSVGFESKEVIISRKDEFNSELFIQLTAKSLLPEVVIAGYGYRQGKVLMGAVARIDSKKIKIVDKIDTIIKADTKFPLTTIKKLHIYPNPVESGTTINIAFNELDEGYYAFQIINTAGQMMLQKEIWIDPEARLLNIDVPLVAAGSYFMILTNKKTGNKFSEKIIIQ